MDDRADGTGRLAQLRTSARMTESGRPRDKRLTPSVHRYEVGRSWSSSSTESIPGCLPPLP